MAIATGGVVPDGADAVVPIEYVVEHDNEVEISEAGRAGAHVRPRGGDVARGEVVVGPARGSSPAQLGALAAAGVARSRARAARGPPSLTTGTELAPPGEELEPGQIYEANGVILAAQLASRGRRGRAARRRSQTTRPRTATRSSAGSRPTCSSPPAASRSARTISCARRRGARRRGGVLARRREARQAALRSACADATLVFGLPGNPVSALVGFELFVRPAVLALQGAARPGPRFEAGTLARCGRAETARATSSCGRAARADGDVVLDPLSGQESHMIVRAAEADALVLVPRGEGELPAGARVRYLPLRSRPPPGASSRRPRGRLRATRSTIARTSSRIGPRGGRSPAAGYGA